MLEGMLKLETYAKENGVLTIINDMGERRFTSPTSINFPNGWRASIVERDLSDEFPCNKKYSVAICDYNGYFDWRLLNDFGGIDGSILCDTEEEILAACEVIKNLES